MLLENGAMIKQDVINSFETAVANPENINVDNTINWNFVDADMHMDLTAFYASDYIAECMETLADAYEADQAMMRLEILKKDFLGMEA